MELSAMEAARSTEERCKAEMEEVSRMNEVLNR